MPIYLKEGRVDSKYGDDNNRPYLNLLFYRYNILLDDIIGLDASFTLFLLFVIFETTYTLDRLLFLQLDTYVTPLNILPSYVRV